MMFGVPIEVVQIVTPEEYAASLPKRDQEYRAMYMKLFKDLGCKGYCVAGTGGHEPRSGQCPFCHAY
jgi:hypothetical protein